MQKYKLIVEQNPNFVNPANHDRQPYITLTSETKTVSVNFGLYDFEACQAASQALGFDPAALWNYIMLNIRPENPISNDLVIIDDIGNVYSILD